MDAHARVRDLGVGSEIPLRLSYTSSTGQLHIFFGTGIIHNDSYIDPSQPNHQIRLENVSFPDLPSISNATFVIQPQDEKIYIICNQLTESNGGPIIYITICMNVNDESVYEPIDDIFISTDIARTADIPTKTSQLTNDSDLVTSTELATKQDKLDSYSDSASVANDKLTINYKVKQEDGTYSNVPVEFTASTELPSNMVTTDTEQEITGKKTIKSTNTYYWAEIGNIDNTDVPGISFKDQYSKVNIYRDSNGYMRIETPTYGTPVQIKNVLIEGKGDGSNTIRGISTSNKIYLGDASRPINTLYAKNLSDGTTTKTMTEVLSGTTEE